MEQAYAEQITKCRPEYDAHIQKLQSRIQELEQLNANLQGFISVFFSADELRKSMEVQKEVVSFFLVSANKRRMRIIVGLLGRC